MRMMMTDFRLAINATGRHKELLSLLDEDSYHQAVEILVKAWAGSVGSRAGYEYGECFRREMAGEIFDKVSQG